MDKDKLDRAVRETYRKVVEQAPKYNSEEELKQFRPWDELPQAWRDDWTSCIAAGIEEYLR